MAACAKHFPGHGDTYADSHHELPVTERVEVAPFAEAIRAGVRSIMTAHLLVPSLDSEPATMSRAILEGLLREELDFQGVVISDAVDMQAIAGTVGVAEGAVRALAAGVDAVCLGPAVDRDGIEAVHSTVVEAVHSGRLAESRLVEAAGRVADLAAWAQPQATERGDRTIGSEAAARALRIEGDVHVGDRPVVVELRPEPLVAAGETGASLAQTLDASEHVLRDGDGIAGLPPGRLVIALRDAARHPWQQRIAEQLLAQRPDAILVETGVPGWRPSRARSFVETHGGGRASLAAAARLISRR